MNSVQEEKDKEELDKITRNQKGKKEEEEQAETSESAQEEKEEKEQWARIPNSLRKKRGRGRKRTRDQKLWNQCRGSKRKSRKRRMFREW